jgi:DNA-binding NarL/FixJ family response regulator
MNNLDPNKLLIVDDHQLFIDGLKMVLRNVNEFNVTAEATNGKDALEIIENDDIDIAIIDIKMPEMSGTELTKILKQRFPEIKVLVVSSYHDEEIILEIFEAEAEGYLLKNAGKQELLLALNKIINGGIYYSKEISEIMIKNLMQRKKQEEIIKKLTEREIEIVRLIYNEFTTIEIAEKLFLSPYTVETHRKHILSKTKSKTVVGLVKYAIRNNLV